MALSSNLNLTIPLPAANEVQTQIKLDWGLYCLAVWKFILLAKHAGKEQQMGSTEQNFLSGYCHKPVFHYNIDSNMAQGNKK